MSKRSYRRLAVVAGAALAVGSMAPAMAAQVGSNNTAGAGVEVETINVGSLLGSVQQNQQLSPTALLGAVTGVQTLATTKAAVLSSDVLATGLHAVSGVQCIVGAGTEAVLGLTALASAGAEAHVGLGSLGLGLDGLAVLGSPVVLVGDATECLGQVRSDVFKTVDDVKGTATAVAGVATGTAMSAVAMAGGLPGSVMTTASPLLLNDILSIAVNGGASSSSAAGLAGLVNFL